MAAAEAPKVAVTERKTMGSDEPVPASSFGLRDDALTHDSLLACRDDDRKRFYDELDAFENFPKEGIRFFDMFSLMRSPSTCQLLLGCLTRGIRLAFPAATAIAGLDSRGFLFGPSAAASLGMRFIPVRKAGKLPGRCLTAGYSTEYSKASGEVQVLAVRAPGRDKAGAASDGEDVPKEKIVVVDDLLATGGTLAASVALLEGAGAEVLGCVVAIELPELEGAAKVGKPVKTLLRC